MIMTVFINFEKISKTPLTNSFRCDIIITVQRFLESFNSMRQ